jgi:DNA-binding CsgD family transcriptional regulator
MLTMGQEPTNNGTARTRPTRDDLVEVVARADEPMIAIEMPDMTIFSVNEHAERLFGRSHDELVGQHAGTPFHGADTVYTTIGLGALASGAIDSCSGQRRLATSPEVVVATTDRLVRLASGERVVTEVAVPIGESTEANLSAPHPRDVLDTLPARQLEIVAALLQGERVSSIAKALYVSASTVRSHLTATFAAFGVQTQSQLLATLRSGGIRQLPQPGDRRTARSDGGASRSGGDQLDGFDN